MDWMVPDDLSASQYEEHIEPVCKNWVVHSLDDQAAYVRRLCEAGLEVVEFEGFDGKDADNITLLDRNLRFSFFMLLSGDSQRMPFIRETITALTALSTAWKKGHFVLGRYCAQKPGKA